MAEPRKRTGALLDDPAAQANLSQIRPALLGGAEAMDLIFT
jgi:hypothetical protein